MKAFENIGMADEELFGCLNDIFGTLLMCFCPCIYSCIIASKANHFFLCGWLCCFPTYYYKQRGDDDMDFSNTVGNLVLDYFCFECRMLQIDRNCKKQ
ncbi:MAG: hypothetical protein MHMPM18_003143 [Marteilia pararefringens]